MTVDGANSRTTKKGDYVSRSGKERNLEADIAVDGMAQIGDPQSAEGPLEPTGSAKKKIMSSNLLNMKVTSDYRIRTNSKFMQRGRDADVAAKLQEQYKKEVSDQQWHLSIVHETKASKYVSAASSSWTCTDLADSKHQGLMFLMSQATVHSRPRGLRIY